MTDLEQSTAEKIFFQMQRLQRELDTLMEFFADAMSNESTKKPKSSKMVATRQASKPYL